MVLLVRFFGVIIVFVGIIFMSRKNAFKNYISFWNNEKRLKAGGVGALLFGILFLVAAPQCRIVWLIAVLGIWSIIKGILLIVISPKKILGYFDWMNSKPASVVRYLSIVAIAFGILLIYSA